MNAVGRKPCRSAALSDTGNRSRHSGLTDVFSDRNEGRFAMAVVDVTLPIPGLPFLNR